MSLDQFVAQENIEKLESTSEIEQTMSSSLLGHGLCKSPAILAVNLKSTVANVLKEVVCVSFNCLANTFFSRPEMTSPSTNLPLINP